MRRLVFTLVALTACTASPLAQQRSAPAGQRRTFEVVSVRRNMTNDVGSNIIDRPDGFTMLNVPVTALLARAYPPALIGDMVNLPRWAMTERYDISATAPAGSTPEQRKEMLRAMLAERFKLNVHTESRDQPAYDLVPARGDRRLGPDVKPSTLDCDAKPAAGRPSSRGAATGERGAPVRGGIAAAAASSCVLLVNGLSLTGDTTMAGLAATLRGTAGRPVIDKTGLKGSYHIAMSADAPAAPPASADTPPIAPLLEERLGLKLVPSMTKGEALVIDRMERAVE